MRYLRYNVFFFFFIFLIDLLDNLNQMGSTYLFSKQICFYSTKLLQAIVSMKWSHFHMCLLLSIAVIKFSQSLIAASFTWSAEKDLPFSINSLSKDNHNWTQFVKSYMHCKKHSAAVFSIEMVTVSESFLSLIDLDINFLETFIKIFIYMYEERIISNFLLLLVCIPGDAFCFGFCTF